MSYNRYNISSITTQYKKQNSKQKSCTSALSPKSRQLNRSNSPKDLTLRYKQLYSKYVTLLEQVKDRDQFFQLQQNQLNRLKSERQRDQRELYRLRSMIGFMKKDDKGIQVNLDNQSMGSWGTKLEKETTAQYNPEFELSKLQKWYVPSKISRKKSPTNRQVINQTFNFNQNAIRTAKLYEKQQKSQNYIQRQKTESIYSPKSSQNEQRQKKQSLRWERKLQSNNKLSNSPYAKLKFSRNIHIN